MKELTPNERYQLMATRIDKVLKTDEFTFEPIFLKALHKYLFTDLLDNCGEFRQTNLFRPESVLDGEMVTYANYFNIERYLSYDLSQESLQKYQNLPQDEFIKKICLLNVKLWLTHPFRDGNTRTISVFMRLLLNKLGYSFDNEEFRKYFSFYRNALVLATYSTPRTCSKEEYLELFFKHILFDPNINLDNIEFKYNKPVIKKLVREE